MKKSDLSRRDFNQLTMAAFGGVVAGSVVGCSDGGGEAGSETASADTGGTEGGDTTETDGGGITEAGGEGEGEAVSLLMGEKHVCRGLNMCKGHGAGGENACAGQGACATYAKHKCTGQNECKGQGGCGNNPGENKCKGEGSCAIPLMDHAWDNARKNFTTAMEAAGKKVGDAPPKG